MDHKNDFNPRSHKGSDPLGQPCFQCQKFQSTLPQGERRMYTDNRPLPEVFQSTLPQGERPIVLGCRIEDLIISIHAPTRGATLDQQHLCICVHNFNPRSHKGSDRQWSFTAMKIPISIHAPTRGATISSLLLYFGGLHFNPRSHKGSD